MANTLVVDIDHPDNHNLFFRPTGQVYRTALDFRRCRAKDEFGFCRDYPDGIPGQRLVLDLDSGTAQVLDELPKLRHIKAPNISPVGPEVQDLGRVHLPTWLHWIRHSVKAGVARVVSGKLPADDGGDAQDLTITRTKDHRDELIDRLVAAVERLTAALGDKRK